MNTNKKSDYRSKGIMVYTDTCTCMLNFVWVVLFKVMFNFVNRSNAALYLEIHFVRIFLKDVCLAVLLIPMQFKIWQSFRIT